MFDQRKVVLIGCLAAFACLLDNFLPSLAEESSVYSHAYDAPRPVRFAAQPQIPMVKPVPPTKKIKRQLELERLAHPDPPDPMRMWMRDLNQRIFANWKEHYGKKERLDVQFEVRRDGSVLGVTVLHGSGNKTTDEDAVRAIEQASPFRPLPRYLSEETVNLQYTFWDHPVTHN
ncbi:MAG: TonB C-terminal domain-containing protein [Cyanobacteria bacterium SZAS-4]|nr:TonB C-terminal domain-containing protein [Cyanobacteria bacterium SZAS-4]